MAVGQKARIRVDTFPGAYAQRPCRGVCARLGRRVLFAAARQCDRQLHQGRAAHIGQDRDRRCGWPERPAGAGHVGHRERVRSGSQAQMSVPAQALPTAPPPGIIAPANVTPPTSIPWLGLFAVLMGTFISTLNTRFSSFGLADVRGAVHAGFDEGAWLTTAQTTAQMLVTIIAVWMGAAYGPRRVLMGASIAFAVIMFIAPFSPNLPTLLTMQFLSGLASGFFIPLTLELHSAQHAAEVLAVRHCSLFTQSRAVAQRLGLARGLVRRSSLLGVDLLAERASRPGDVAMSEPRHPHQADHDPPAGRCLRSHRGRRGSGADLCGARSGQSARLAQFRPCVGAARRRERCCWRPCWCTCCGRNDRYSISKSCSGHPCRASSC